MSTYVIGDIHGEIDQVKTIFDKINYNPADDKLIFVGDYVDRGKNSYEVYKFIKTLANDKNIFLRGNHEEMMIDAVLNENRIDLWYHNGGQSTEGSFPNKSVLKEAAEYFNSFPYYYADSEYIIVHAGIHPDKKLREQSNHDLIWIRNEFINTPAEKFKENRTVIAGHTPVAEVKFMDNKILLDTGAGKGGILSAVELENKQVFKSKDNNPLMSLF